MKGQAGVNPAKSRPVAVVRPRVRGTAERAYGAWTKITMHLAERHIAYLDLITQYMCLRYHRPVPRAEIVQALVEFMQQSEIDYTRFSTIEEMTGSLAAYFRAPQWRTDASARIGLVRGLYFRA